MEPVRSIRNPRVAAAVRLRRARERRATGRTLLEGPHLLEEAIGAGVDVVEVFAHGEDPPRRDVPWTRVTQDVLDRLAPTEHPRGPVAVVVIPEERPVGRDALVIDVGDPGNAGTLIRSAAAFGLDVVFRAGSVDPWSPKVLRAAAGAHFRTTVSTTADQDRPRGSIVTVVRGGVDHRQLARVLDPGRSWDLLVGSEPHGVDPDEAQRADVTVSIPMPGGTESLNAAVAGSIVAEELGRWRAAVGPPDASH